MAFSITSGNILVFFIFFIILGIWGILYEDDIPFAGFFWVGILAIIYCLLREFFITGKNK